MHRLERLQSGIPGLDALLSGGLVAGASYIVQGHPGSGKTIFANQIAFHHAKAGNQVLFATLLSESHDRLFQFLSTLSFFDRSRIGTEIHYVSAFDALENEGLDEVVTLLRREIVRQKASLLVVDGLVNARMDGDARIDAKRFIARLQGHAAFAGCTVIFLTSSTMEDGGPEHTMVDGVIELGEHLIGSRTFRRIRLRKTRGSPALGGLHEIEITSDGIVVHPRLEAFLRHPSRFDLEPPVDRVASGIPGFDEMIGGGLPRASSSLLLGPSGCGKTTMGLAFLQCCTVEDPGILFGLYETAARLLLKAEEVGLKLKPLVDSGALTIVWERPTERLLDALGHRLLDVVYRTGAKRLFIDSLSAMSRATTMPDRTVDFFTALMNELRAHEITVLASWEMRDLFGEEVHAPTPELSGLVDNLVLMRYMKQGAELRRVVSVLKVRDSTHDPLLREFVVTKEGASLQRMVEPVVIALPSQTVSRR